MFSQLQLLMKVQSQEGKDLWQVPVSKQASSNIQVSVVL